MYLRRLVIENLRSLENVVLEPNVPEQGKLRYPNVTLLLGNNGLGKTSVLRAVALAVLAPILASSSGYVPYSLVRRTNAPARNARIHAIVAIHPEHQEGPAGDRALELALVPTSSSYVDRAVSNVSPELADPMWDETSAAFLVVGYGASRRTETKDALGEQMRLKTRALRYGRVAGLFEEAISMVPLGSWLPPMKAANPGRYSQVITLLDQLLPNVELLPEPVRGEYVFRRLGSDLPFDALSDGYRAYIGWVADLLYHICMGAPSGAKLVEARGIVLVDEIDLHLHPEWQKTVVPTLATTFPKLQFILTTHSPLVVGTLHRQNIRVLTRDTRSESLTTRLDEPKEETFGLSADQILTGEHFGLASTRNDAFLDSLATIARRAEEDPSAALEFMTLLTQGGEAREPESPRPKPKKAPKRTAAKTATSASRKSAPKAQGKPAAKLRKKPGKKK